VNFRFALIARLAPAFLIAWASMASGASPSVRSLPEFSSLVETHGPAVVNISTTQVIKRSAARNSEDERSDNGAFNDLLKRYFGEEEPQPDSSDNKSLGSGFIISADGYILTCAHVVENASEIIVRLTDRREFLAKAIGADRRSDVALLKIDARGLPTVRIGNPGQVRVGEWVLAIGSPFGFENSATAGIVSAKGRSLPRENYVPFIQTDVAINPGNSGGPLFNMRGEVIGINSQIYSRTGGFMGLSFAVPIDIAIQVSQQLKSGGKVRRGWLGVTIQDVTRELAESFGMKRPSGALIADILSDSPAARTDLQVGDIVTEYEGQAINLSSDLPPLVGRTVPGTRVRLGILRGGKPKNVGLTIAELPEEAAAIRPMPSIKKGPSGVLGMHLRQLTDTELKQLALDNGLLVDSISDGPALRAGLKSGDVIVKIQGKAVHSPKEFNEIVRRLPTSRPVPVLVRRGAAALFLALRLP